MKTQQLKKMKKETEENTIFGFSRNLNDEEMQNYMHLLFKEIIYANKMRIKNRNKKRLNTKKASKISEK
jgi:hemerythrin superfamily protein